MFVNITLIHWLAALFYPIAKRPGRWLELQGYKSEDWFTDYLFCYYGCMMMIMGYNTAPSDSTEVFPNENHIGVPKPVSNAIADRNAFVCC